MLKYTKQQWQNRRFRQAVGITVICAMLAAAIFVTVAVVSDNEPEFNNQLDSSQDN